MCFIHELTQNGKAPFSILTFYVIGLFSDGQNKWTFSAKQSGVFVSEELNTFFRKKVTLNSQNEARTSLYD